MRKNRNIKNVETYCNTSLRKMRQAFTLVELIVVITILTILRTVAFVSYEGQVEGSRNTARQSDILTLGSTLKNHKLKNGAYPNPGDYFNIMNNGTGNIVAKQGFMNSKVYSTEITTAPLDPNYKIPYLYSVTKNNGFYELATIIEPLTDADTTKTYLVGDYQTVSKDVLPTILLATSTGANNNIEIASGSINRLTFLANNSSLNVPYNDESTSPVKTATTFDSIFTETGVTYSQFPGYSSCLEIYEAGRSIGSGSYQVLDANGAVTNTGCSMNFNFCSTQPSYTNASFTTGTPTLTNQSWQNTNSSNPCYYTCINGYTGVNCTTLPIVGAIVAQSGSEIALYAGVYTGGHGKTLWVAGTENTGLAWKDTGTTTINTSSIIDGRLNTGVNDINYKSSVSGIRNTNHPAGDYCANLNWAGYSDWYLPAQRQATYDNTKTCVNQPGEMQFLYCQHKGTGSQSLLGFSRSRFWSSTQWSSNNTYAMMLPFYIVDLNIAPKTAISHVRCVRVAD